MRRLVFLVPLIVLAGAGCGSKRNIVGVWVGTEQVRTINEKIEFDLKSDGSYTFQLTLQGMDPNKQIIVQESGSYRMVGDNKLGTTGQSYMYSGLTGERLEQLKKFMEEDKGKESLDTVTWTDNDNIVLRSDDDQPLTLKRKK